MALVLKDRVRESTATTGTGTLSLDGAITGFQGFSVIGNTNTTYYAVVDVTTGDWEVGLGTYTSAGSLLSRDTVLESSSGGTKINFGAGPKDVFCTYPAEQAVTLNDVQTLTNKTINLTSNTLVATSAQIAAAVTDETGTGALVFANSPTLVTPALGTPASGVVTNLTGTASININGTVGATTPASGSFTSLTDSGNLAFTGTGNRITGDFSNATVANRVAFQTSTANGNTILEVIPNGTGNTTSILCETDAGLVNTSFAQVLGSTTEVSFRSGIRGTGTYQPMTFHTGGSERVRIDTSGNVGIGTSSPAYRLSVSGVTNTGIASFSGNSDGNLPGTDGDSVLVISSNFAAGNAEVDYFHNNSAFKNTVGGHRFLQRTGASTAAELMWLRENLAIFSTGGTERMRINSAGNVGIGTSSPSGRLDTRASGDYDPALFVGSNTSAVNWARLDIKNHNAAQPAILYQDQTGAFFIRTDGANPIAFFTNGGNERMRIDSSGNLLWAKTSANPLATGIEFGTDGANVGRLSIGGANSSSATSLSVYSTTASAFRFFVTYAGQINATSTSITAISDRTLKENIRDLETGLTEVMALKPRRFDWKAETQLDEKNVAGFIAQEVEQVLPELVYDYQYNADETKKSLKMGDILPTLVKAMQEMKAVIDSQAERISALEAK
jgi:hypothetical protein